MILSENDQEPETLIEVLPRGFYREEQGHWFLRPLQALYNLSNRQSTVR